MPGAARLGDIGSAHGCFPPTPIISASSGVFINGIPAGRCDWLWWKYRFRFIRCHHWLVSKETR